MAENNAILTKDNMIKWKWVGNPLCQFGQEHESVNHLFFECVAPGRDTYKCWRTRGRPSPVGCKCKMRTMRRVSMHRRFDDPAPRRCYIVMSWNMLSFGARLSRHWCNVSPLRVWTLKSFFLSFSLPIPFLVVPELLFSRYDQWEWGCSKKK